MSKTLFSAALTTALFLSSPQLLHADVKTDERGLVKFEGTLGRVVGLFGGKAHAKG